MPILRPTPPAWIGPRSAPLLVLVLAASACLDRTPPLPQPRQAAESPTAGATTADPRATPGTAAGQGRSGEASGTPAAAAPLPDYSLQDDAPLPPSGEVDGIPVGLTRQGHPYRGAPDAPLTVEEFSDYHCPFCARFATEVQPTLLQEYAAAGKVRFVFREFPIISLHPNAAQVAAAALCTGEQSAEAYWRLHDALYRQQGASTDAIDLAGFLSKAAADAGADTAAFAACTGREAALNKRLQASVDRGRALGFDGTPSFIMTVDGLGSYPFVGAQPVERFRAWFDALLAGQAPPAEAPEATAAAPELPFWASPAGLAPDPTRSGRTMGGDAFAGRPDAPLTVMEFTDFQCPPCRDYALNHHPAVAEALVDSGKVFWVVKQRPLPEHAQSAVAAAAAECALAQDRFWPMYTALFQAVERWSVAAPDDALAAVAEDAGLDPAAFRRCLAGREATQAVLTDILEAGGIAPTTPTFLVIEGGRGSLLRGAQKADELIKVLEGWQLTATATPTP